MKRIIGEWVWRVAMVCALGWVGLEVHGLREDLAQPADNDPAATAQADDGDDSQGCPEVVRQRTKASWPKIAAPRMARTTSR